MKNKMDLIETWDGENVGPWINDFILSDTTRSEKIDILKFINPKLNDINKNGLSAYHETFISLTSEKQYSKALKLCDLLSYRAGQNQKETEDIIKSKNIYFLSPKLEIEMGGLGRTVLYRANFLAEEGYSITLLNIGPVKNYDYIIEFFKKEHLFSDNLSFINIFEYYSKKNTVGDERPSLDDNSSDDIITKQNSDMSVTLNYYDENSELIKSEIYIDECLVYQECDEFNRYFTKDGFNYLTNDKVSKKYTLKEQESGFSYEFDDKNQLLYHFLDEICLDTDKPFIVCDSTSHWYDANGISPNDAYKIGSMHGSPFINFNPKNKISPKINHLTHFDSIHRLVILTNDLKNDLKDKFDGEKLVVIPNFVFEKNLEYEPVEKDLNKIAMFSRISPEKQISHAIKAFETISKKNSDAVLEIYGAASNPYEEEEDKKLKELVGELKLEDRVIFKGFCSDISKPMQESLAVLLTSKHEGLPLSILEAMTNSTAVISYDCYYGPKELISNNVDGFLIQQNNIEQLIESVLKLLDNPQKAIEMGKKGKEKIISDYTLSNIGPMWKKLFCDIYVECELDDFMDEIALRDEYSSVVSENKKLSQFKSDILSSTSWKITKPLRKTMQIFKGKK